jgi:hypothetical protein
MIMGKTRYHITADIGEPTPLKMRPLTSGFLECTLSVIQAAT